MFWEESKRIKRKRFLKSAIKKALHERTNFTESKVIKGEGENLYYLAIDDIRRKVFYVFGDKKVLCDFKDIKAVNIVENGSVLVSKKTTKRPLAGIDIKIEDDKEAKSGASVLGKSTNRKRISSMYVHVFLKHPTYSSIDFKCFDDSREPFSQGHYRILSTLATMRAEELYDLFMAIIEEVDANRDQTYSLRHETGRSQRR